MPRSRDPGSRRASVATVGYSDHTIGISAAVLSVALGARVIEKHFTLDKNQSDFHDHSSPPIRSISPNWFGVCARRRSCSAPAQTRAAL